MSHQDEHLVYVPARAEGGEYSRYDVYSLDGGSQLGWVAMIGANRWRAWTETGFEETARSRWGAAATLWPDRPRSRGPKRRAAAS